MASNLWSLPTSGRDVLLEPELDLFDFLRMNGEVGDGLGLVPINPKLDVVLEGQTLRTQGQGRGLLTRRVEKALPLSRNVEALCGVGRRRRFRRYRRRCRRAAAEVVVFIKVKVGIDPTLNEGIFSLPGYLTNVAAGNLAAGRAARLHYN